jgi:hypothetical protein
MSTRSKFTKFDITGRDNFIIAQALATAYALICSLPDHCQSRNNANDMAKLLRSIYGESWKISAHYARHSLSEQEWRHGLKPFGRNVFDDYSEEQ